MFQIMLGVLIIIVGISIGVYAVFSPKTQHTVLDNYTKASCVIIMVGYIIVFQPIW